MMTTKMIGNKIADARKKINISQAQLAQHLFISPQAVGKWERGESMPDISTLTRLAEILNVDLNYFSEKAQPVNDNIDSAKANANNDITNETEGNDPQSASQERDLLTDFSASSLMASDFAGVTAHNRKFKASDLRGSDFTNADLTGSSFTASDVREAIFKGTNLTDCTLSVLNLKDAIFRKSILIRTDFSKSELTRVQFIDINFIDVKLTMTDLRHTIFENCTFSGVDFKDSDLRGLHLDGQIFTGVKFDRAGLTNVSFKGATLKNVSFHASYALTNKYYRAISTINFDEAKMDRLTFASLKGLGANLSKVELI